MRQKPGKVRAEVLRVGGVDGNEGRVCVAAQVVDAGPLVAAISPAVEKYSDFEIFAMSAGSFFRCSELARSGTTPP